jgi:hypothetical protein
MLGNDLPDGLHEPSTASSLPSDARWEAEALVGAAMVQPLNHLKNKY